MIYFLSFKRGGKPASVRLVLDSRSRENIKESPSASFQTINEKKMRTVAKMDALSSSKPVANNTPKKLVIVKKAQPAVNQIYPTNPPDRQIVSSLPTAKTPNYLLIPTNQLPELQQKILESFPNCRGPITITSVKRIQPPNPSVKASRILIVPSPLSSTPTAPQVKQQLSKCSPKPKTSAERQVCLSNPAKPLSITIKTVVKPKQPVELPVRLNTERYYAMPGPSNAPDQELFKVIKVSHFKLFSFLVPLLSNYF